MQDSSLVGAAALAQEVGDVVVRDAHALVALAQHAGLQGEQFTQTRLGLVELAGAPVQLGDVAETDERVRVLGSEVRDGRGQRLLVASLRCLEALRLDEQGGEVGQRSRKESRGFFVVLRGENIGGSNFGDDTRFVGVTLGGPCPGDVNGNGVVNFDDLSIVLGNFGTVCD